MRNILLIILVLTCQLSYAVELEVKNLKHFRRVIGAAYSPDEKLLITQALLKEGEPGNTVWEIASGKKIVEKALSHDNGMSEATGFVPNTNYIYSTGTHGAKVWNYQTHELVSEIKLDSFFVDEFEFDYTTKRVIATGFERIYSLSFKRTVNVLDFETRTKQCEAIYFWNQPQHEILNISLHPSEPVVAVALTTGDVDIVSTLDCKRLNSFKASSPFLREAHFVADGSAIIAFSSNIYDRDDEEIIEKWDYKTLTLQRITRFNSPKTVFKAVFSPDGNWAATVNSTNQVSLWSLENEKLSYLLTDKEQEIVGIKFSPNSKMLLSTQEAPGNTSLWSVETGNLIASTLALLEWPTKILFRSDSEQFVLNGTLVHDLIEQR